MGSKTPLQKAKLKTDKAFYFVAVLLIVLTFIIYLEFNQNKKMIGENFSSQQASRALIKTNLILNNGLVLTLSGLIANDEDLFFDGLDLVEYSLGYLSSGPELVEITKANIPAKIMDLSGSLQSLWNSSRPVSQETVELLNQEIQSIYLILGEVESEGRHLIAVLSVQQAGLSKKLAISLIIFSLSTILLVSLTYYKRRKAELLLQDTNIYLEEQVGERTAELKERESIFKLLAHSMDGEDEQEIFNNFVKACVKIFKAEYSIIGRLDDQTISTCSFIAEGELQPYTSYSFPGTPSEKTINDGFCEYYEGVQEQYRDAEIIQKYAVEGYVGCSLLDKTGKVIGVVNVFSRQPMEIFEYTREVMKLIALHCSNLIERQINKEIQNELSEQIFQAQKMEAIGTLAGGIAHDFNNLLTPILGYSEMALATPNIDAALKEDIETIRQSSLRAKELVKQILTISRKHTHEEFPLKIHLIIKEVLKMLNSALPATIRIVPNIDKNSSLILADPSRINQLIMNLCVNASQAMESAGGTLTIELNNRELDKDSGRPSILPGSYVCLSITDTGCGVPTEIREQLYDPYFTTKEEGKGTGLGLATVRAIVDSYKGYIFMESELGQGTTFELFFPAVSPEESIEHEESSKVLTLDISNVGRIVLVDDDINVLDVMKAILTKLGCTVDPFSNPSEALNKIISQPESYDLLITDQIMPDITGLTLVKQLQQSEITIPSIIISGQPLVVSEEIQEKFHIKSIMKKPIEMHQVKSAIDSVLGAGTGQ